jgi:hypothetical protein
MIYCVTTQPKAVRITYDGLETPNLLTNIDLSFYKLIVSGVVIVIGS